VGKYEADEIVNRVHCVHYPAGGADLEIKKDRPESCDSTGGQTPPQDVAAARFLNGKNALAVITIEDGRKRPSRVDRGL
jgi:hypothetical protein